MGRWIAEMDQDPVTHIIRYEPAETSDRFSNAFLIGGDHLSQIFRVHPRGQRGRSERRSTNITITCRRSGVLAEAAFSSNTIGGDPFAALLPRKRAMASSSLRRCPTIVTPQVFQILGGQGQGENRFVNLVFAKCRCVALKTEALPPTCQIHGVAREGGSCRSGGAQQ